MQGETWSQLCLRCNATTTRAISPKDTGVAACPTSWSCLDFEQLDGEVLGTCVTPQENKRVRKRKERVDGGLIPLCKASGGLVVGYGPKERDKERREGRDDRR